MNKKVSMPVVAQGGGGGSVDLTPYAKKLDVFGNDATIAVYDITTANTTITLQRLTGLTSIDWGDGTVTGSTVLSHTYVDTGKYVVLIYGVTAFGDTAFGAASGGSQRLYRIKFASYVSSLGQYALRNTGLVELDIPDTITSLGAMVCWNAATLKKVSIGTGVAALNQYSFYECYALSEVELSKPINISNNVFDSCTSLAKVYFKGTKAEWDAITIGTGNTPLQNATKYYLSDGSGGNTDVLWSVTHIVIGTSSGFTVKACMSYDVWAPENATVSQLVAKEPYSCFATGIAYDTSNQTTCYIVGKIDNNFHLTLSDGSNYMSAVPRTGLTDQIYRAVKVPTL